MLSNSDDDKKIVTLKTAFQRMLSFQSQMFCTTPCVVPLDHTIAYMIQSGGYILTPDFITSHRKMDFVQIRRHNTRSIITKNVRNLT